MIRHRKNPADPDDRRGPAGERETTLRIIGGELRGRKLLYMGHVRTRPMKDRLRETVFNLLGPSVAGKHALDLFAGTGALALEAISRGAARATLVEQHFPTARIVGQNAALLGVAERCDVAAANVFHWAAQTEIPTDQPWLVFCSPPYAFYVERQGEMLALINSLVERSPADSLFAVESDARFDTALLPDAARWDVRTYPPAVVSIGRK